MKRRVMCWVLAASMLLTVLTPVNLVWAEEEEELTLSVPEKESVQSKDEGEKSETESALDSILNSNASVMETLGQKDWESLAEGVRKSGDWREDLVAVAQSQVGYEEDASGMTIYTKWAGYESAREWTALFVNWAAEKSGLSGSEFPRGSSFSSLKDKMSSVDAVKKISRATYPVSGDLALIELNGQQLVGIVVYVNNGFAYVIHGDDHGEVTGETYAVGTTGFTRYVDLNVLMERAGVDVGKGGEVPEIPEGGVAAWTNTNSVYMRKEPTTASKRVTMVKKANTALVVTSAALQDDGYIWYGVTYGRYTGYIRGDLVELDMAALATATPEPTAAPTATPTATPEPTEVPGCLVCAYEADGAELPVECCYEHLSSMTAEESYEFMSGLLEEDYITFMLYVNCHNAHVYDGSNPAVICYTGCEQSIFSPVAPGEAHSAGCGWYVAPVATEAPTATPEPTEAPTATPEPTVAPTAEPTVAPTAEPTVAPTAEPTTAPTEAPTDAPADVVDCALCEAESEYWGIELPANGCVYEHLKSLSVQEAYALMSELDWNNYSAYRMYTDCHNDHVMVGDDIVICHSDVCHAGAYTQPGAAHTTDCPWYMASGLSTQERVVNIEVVQGTAGQSVNILFEIYGATAYEWHEVRTDDSASAPTDMILTDAVTDTLTVTAKTDASYSYYCIATIEGGTTVKSKITVVSVSAAPIMADAILGEEVNLTYTNEDAVSYCWKMTEAVGTDGDALTDETVYTGMDTATLTFAATADTADKLYYCVATLADGTTATSAYYQVTVKAAGELTDEDLCKYVEELANMTRVERYEIMTGLWTNSYVDEAAATTLADKVLEHWTAEHKSVYATLLCTCETMKSAYDTSHSSDCPWYNKVSTSKVERPVYCDICADMCDYHGAELPESECYHEQLKDQTPSQIYTYLSELDLADYGAYDACRESLLAHADAGDSLIVCPGTSTCAGIFVAPGAEHTAANCPWNPDNYETEDDLTNATDYTTSDNVLNIKVADGAFAQDYVLNASAVDVSTVSDAIKAAVHLANGAENNVLAAYDISFTAVADGATKLQPTQAVTLTFTVPSTLVDGVEHTLYVFHMLADGTADAVGVFPVTQNNQTVTIQATAFSTYAVAQADTTDVECTICAAENLPTDITGNAYECVYEHAMQLGTPQAQYAYFSWMDNFENAYTGDVAAYASAYYQHIEVAKHTAVLCSCSGTYHPLSMSIPGPSHAEGCPWRVASDSIVLDFSSATAETNVVEDTEYTVYVDVELVITSVDTEGKVTYTTLAKTVNLGDQYTYIQDVVDQEGETVALNVAYLHIDSDGRPWIIPLMSEKDIVTETN